MIRTTLACLLTLTASSGCAHAPTIPETIRAARSGVAGVSVAADASKPVVDAATDVLMEHCEAFPEGEPRAKCMGALGMPVAPLYEELGEAYDKAVDALEALEAAWEQLEPVLEQARTVTEDAKR